MGWFEGWEPGEPPDPYSPGSEEDKPKPPPPPNPDLTAYAYQQKAAAEAREAEKLAAQTELEKTKTDYLLEQMKLAPLPQTQLSLGEIQAKENGIPWVLIIGAAVLYFTTKKGRVF